MKRNHNQRLFLLLIVHYDVCQYKCVVKHLMYGMNITPINSYIQKPYNFVLQEIILSSALNFQVVWFW